MNVRTFREEVAEAFLVGFQLSMESVHESELIVWQRHPDKMREAIMRKAQQYATMRVLNQPDGTLEPMS